MAAIISEHARQSHMPAERAQSLRRRIQARYPILADGAILPQRQAGWAGSFARAMVDLALRSLRPQGDSPQQAASGPVRSYTPTQLRSVCNRCDSTPLPGNAAITQIAVIEVAPRKLYAYWNAPDARSASLRLRLSDAGRSAALALRFHDITGVMFDGSNAVRTFDIDLPSPCSGKYLELWESDRSYLVDLGLRAADGRFLALARSQSIHMPRERAQPMDKPRFLAVEANRLPPLLPAMPARFTVGATPMLVADGERDWPLRDLEAESLVRAAYQAFLAEGPRALRLSCPFARRDPRILEDEFARREERRQSQAASTAAVRRRQSESQKPDVFCERIDDGNADPWPGRGRSASLLSPLAAHPPPAAPGDRRSHSICAWAVHLGQQPHLRPALPRLLAAPAAGRRKKVVVDKAMTIIDALEDAGVELEAELVLRGRVKPGRRLRVDGQIIETAPDGTFCVSCVIREGRIHVPVEVVTAEMVIARQDFTAASGPAVAVAGP